MNATGLRKNKSATDEERANNGMAHGSSTDLISKKE